MGLLGESCTGLGEVVKFLDALNDALDLSVDASVDLVLDSLLVTGGINLLLELLVSALELIESVESLIKLVFLQLDLMSVSLDHDLLNLVLCNVLIDSIFLAGLKSWQFVSSESSRGHIEAFEWNTEGLTDVGIIDVENTLVLLLIKLFLSGLNLACQYH